MEVRDLLSFLGLERENPQKRILWILTIVINAINYGRVPRSIESLLDEIDQDTGLKKRILLARVSVELGKGEESKIIILAEEEPFKDKGQLCFPATTELIVNGESRGNAVVIMFNPGHPILNRRKQRGGLRVKQEEMSDIINSLLQAQAMVENADKNREPLLTQGEFAEVLRSP